MARKSTTTRATAKPNTAQTEGQDQTTTNTQGETGTGKPDQTHTPPSSLAGQAGGNAGGEGDTAFAAGNTAPMGGERVQKVDIAAAVEAGLTPGARRSVAALAGQLSAGSAFHTYEGHERLTQVDAAGNVLSPEAGATGDGGPADPPADDPAMITVICHAKDGRRRLDRRWPEGETTVPVGELTDTEIALLRGDPRFTVILPT